MPTQKEQWEEEAIERFTYFLNQRRGTVYAVTGRDVHPDPSSNKDFDYQIQDAAGAKAAVEIFRLVEDGKELAQSKVWGQVVTLLKEELLKRNVRGYLISTPYFSVRKRQLVAYSAQLADQLETAIKDNADKTVFEFGNFEFRKLDSLATVAFSTSASARFVDATGTSVKRFVDLLPTKNQQLGTKEHEKILLVLNWAHFVDASDAIHALTKIDFGRFANIERVYFEQKVGEFYQIFDRSVLAAIEGAPGPSEISPLMLETLRYKLGDKDQKAFAFVKRCTVAAGDISWFTDCAAKENLIHFGEELLKAGALDDVLWIIRQLENDPDPPLNGNNSADDRSGEFNYHVKVAQGDDVSVITTVRGHLCWLMMRLIVQNKPELYAEILQILSRYISEPNLYIRIQATYPLGELVRRRSATRNQDGSQFIWKESERKLAFDLAFRMLRDNAGHPRVLQALLHVFIYLHNLTQEQAAEVLRIFLAPGADYILRDLPGLIIYFALFRKHHFPDLGEFDDREFKRLLRTQIEAGPSAIRTSLAWHFWKLMQEHAVPYIELKEYFPVFWTRGYSRSLASTFGLVFEELAQKAPSDAVDLFERMLLLLREDLLSRASDRVDSWVNGVEHIYPLLAQDPERLVRITKLLKEIWLAGCSFVGDLSTIFESYVFVSEPAREATKAELQAIYAEMKSHQPQLPIVNWGR